MFRLGIIPVVNENDTVSTYEMHFGDNDTLSAIVASLAGADSADPAVRYRRSCIRMTHEKIRRQLWLSAWKRWMQHYDAMAKQSTGSDVGTGGMATKLSAARIATASGTDMIIANGKDVGIIHQIISGTISVVPYFSAQNDETFDIHAYLQENQEIRVLCEVRFHGAGIAVANWHPDQFSDQKTDIDYDRKGGT